MEGRDSLPAFVKLGCRVAFPDLALAGLSGMTEQITRDRLVLLLQEGQLPDRLTGERVLVFVDLPRRHKFSARNLRCQGQVSRSRHVSGQGCRLTIQLSQIVFQAANAPGLTLGKSKGACA
jgi:hypothetical protein